MNNKEFNELQNDVTEIRSSHERRLGQGYLDTLASFKLQLSEIYEKHAVDGVIPREVWYKFNYLKRMEKQLIEQITALTIEQNEIIKESIVEVFEETYYRNSFSITQSAMVAFPIFGLLTAKVIKSIMFDDSGAIKWNKRHERNNRKLIKQMKIIIRDSAIKGKPYEYIAKQLTERMDVGRRKALKVSQNETQRVYSEGTQRSMEDAVNKGVVMKKRWLSTLDGTTRDLHRDLDGQTVGVDEYFVIGSRKAKCPKKFGVAEHDINCRCTTIAIFEGLEPTVRMSREIDNKRGEIIEYKNYNEWKSSLV